MGCGLGKVRAWESRLQNQRNLMLAKEALALAVDRFNAMNDKLGANANKELGHVYRKLNESDHAKEHYTTAVSFYKEMNEAAEVEKVTNLLMQLA